MKKISLPFLSDTQRDLRDTIHDLLEQRHNGPAPDPAGRDAVGLWSALTDLGIGGVLVPEELGGLGLGAVEYCLLGLELGWYAVSQPVLDHVATSGVVARHGCKALADAWLGDLLTGRAICTLTSPRVPFAIDADSVDAILCVSAGNAYLVAAENCKLVRLQSMDSNRRIFRVEHPRRAEDLLSADPAAIAYIDDLTALGSASFLTGLAARMFFDARDYAAIRKQFGRPIGSFQAVAHKLASCYVLVERAVVTTLRAAQEYDRRADDVAVSIARTIAGHTAQRLSLDVLQTFGGIGFTAEHHIGHWLKLGKAHEATGGSVRLHRDRISDAWFSNHRSIGRGPEVDHPSGSGLNSVLTA